MAESAGKAIAPTELKANSGRGVALRPKDHQGQRSDPTAFAALKRAAAGQEDKPPTDFEMGDLLRSNPSKVRALKAAGFTNEQIYEMLNR